MIKANNRLKLSLNVVFNSVRYKVKPRFELLYKLLKEAYVHNPLIDIYLYPTLIQLKYFIGEIHNCVIVVGTWVFISNFLYILSLAKDKLDYCCINDNERN